jgi:hypothetical protein
MLQEWLGETHLASFVATQLGRGPTARASTAARAVPLLTWETLDRLLQREPAPDVLVAARGQLVDAPAPRSLGALSALMERGTGVVIRRAERWDDGLAELADAFAADFSAPSHIQVFATPAGTHGFGWHYDVEHVFIAQTAGIKDYYFRCNTVSPLGEVPPDFTRFAGERSPLATARLIAGDWLYLPARWWHMAKCVEPSLSLSIGVLL